MHLSHTYNYSQQGFTCLLRIEKAAWLQAKLLSLA